VEIHRSAFKHGVAEEDLRHAIDNALGWFDLDPEADPPKASPSARTVPAICSRSSSSRSPTSGGW
jgi:hypothetical protein